MTNVQAHGGGAGGFASLGALILGTTAMKKLCNRETGAEPGDAPLPPDAEEDQQGSGKESGDQDDSQET